MKRIIITLTFLVIFCITIVSADQTGSIYVDSNPQGAEIWLDGLDAGHVTPYQFDGLTPGSHPVKVTLSGYPDQEQDVQVIVGSLSSVFFDLTNIPPLPVVPYITPTSGGPGEPFTIYDPEGRMQSGDWVLFYLPGTDPTLGNAVHDVVVSADGKTLTGTVPGACQPQTQHYVRVLAPIGGISRFADLAFFVTAGPACIPTTEVCNGVDDDCDGQIDESLSRACYTGSPETEGVGVCHGGTQTCTEGEWGPCFGELTPQSEVCNLLDDDCNGAVDGGLCTPGACEGGGMHLFWDCMGGFCSIRDTKACTKQLSDYYYERYQGTQYSGCGEAVQSLLGCSADNGCCSLGTEQEQKQCMDTNCPELYGNVYPTDADGDNYNELYDCDDNNDQVNPAAVEVCDGKDNDCDGIVDECAPGETCIGGTCTTAPSVPEFPTVAVPIGILGAFAIVVLVAGKKLI